MYLAAGFRIEQQRLRLSAVRPIRAHFFRTVARQIGPHDHDFFEITLVVAGEGEHVLSYGTSALRRGCVLALAPEEVHGYNETQTGSKGLQLWNIYYLVDWLLLDLPLLWKEPHLVDLFLAKHLFPRHKRRQVPEFSLNEAELALAEEELKVIEGEWNGERPSLVFLKSAFLKLLVILSRAYGRSGGAEVHLNFRPEVWRVIERVDAELARGDGIDFANLADGTGVSRDHLARMFKDATGWTPMEYFQERRIQVACARLLDERLSISEVAHELNFSDSAHFTRHFSKRRGMSPRAYRKRFHVS